MKYNRNTKKCSKCGKDISLSNFARHINTCGRNRKNKAKILDENWKIGENKYQCPVCDKIFTKLGVVAHYRYSHLNEVHPKTGKRGENSWTLAKKNGVNHILTDKQRKYFESEKCYQHLRNVGDNWWKNPNSMAKFKKSIRLAINKNPEAYSAKNVCGRTKIVEYNGFYLNGKWELDVAKWLDENNIRWTNIVNGFKYEWKNELHTYFPDFYLLDFDVYLEVKGFERERDRCKWRVLDNLIILKKNEIEKIRNNTYIAQW